MPRIHENHMTVGSLIEVLDTLNQYESLYFDFCHQRPLGLESYRGYYEDVAISWGDAYTRALTVGTLKRALQERVGKTQHGYKGGTFLVTPNTAAWVANNGETGDTAIIGIRNVGWCVLIETAYAG